MAIKLCRVVTYGQKTPHTKSPCLLIKWSRDKCKILICTSAISMATIIGRIVTYGGGPNLQVHLTF